MSKKFTDDVISGQLDCLNENALSYLYKKYYVTARNFLLSQRVESEKSDDLLADALIELWCEYQVRGGKKEFPTEQRVLTKLRQLTSQPINHPSGELNAVQKNRVRDIIRMLDEETANLLQITCFENPDYQLLESIFGLQHDKIEHSISQAFWKVAEIYSILEDERSY
jgi:hypothetical protein